MVIPMEIQPDFLQGDFTGQLRPTNERVELTGISPWKLFMIHNLQCEAPKIAKLVYNSNNYGLWYL